MIRGRVVRLGMGVLLWTAASVGGGGQTKASNTDAKSGEQKDFTIQTTSRLVLLDVSVKDAAGGFVSGLTKDNFKVFENGKPQEISQFANADIPVTVGIVVDESGSMRPKRAQVITAALVFIQASNPMDEMFVVNFNEKARRGLPDDVLVFRQRAATAGGACGKAIRRVGPRYTTRSKWRCISSNSDRQAKKTLVVISDGGDNHSKHTLARSEAGCALVAGDHLYGGHLRRRRSRKK